MTVARDYYDAANLIRRHKEELTTFLNGRACVVGMITWLQKRGDELAKRRDDE